MEYASVPGFEDRYIISRNGEVVNKTSGKKLKILTRNNGYPHVALYDGRMRMRRLHRLVAKAFIPNPMNYSDVNHIDGDKMNNAVSNLEWCSRSQNIKHAYETGLRPRIFSGSRSPKLSTDEIKRVKELLEGGMKPEKIAKMFNVSRTIISYIRDARYKTYSV